MSYGRDGMNGGYANGYRNQQPPSRYDEGYQNGPPGNARRARRAGGYGGFQNQEQEEVVVDNGAITYTGQDPYSAPAVPAWRRDRMNQENGNGNAQRGTQNNRGYGDGPGARQIEGVVQHIHEKWDFLAQDECVPVHVALQLMDYSSLGRGNDYDDFKRTSQTLHRALRAIVNENHQGFNSSIGTFHKIQASIQTSQERVRTLKTSLSEAKANLTIAKPELKGLAAASHNFDEMLQIISQIEKIQTLPEQLDARISDKHFLTAVDILQDGLRLIRNSNLENLGALTDLRSYLSNQETSLTDILLEELHDHLYLKSAYCQNRWKSYPQITGDALQPDLNVANMSTGIRPLYRFLTGLNVQIPMVDDASRNPEEDNFEYIHMILEALNKMGRLDVAVDRMGQRLPIELFAVVEKTNQEVDTRHPVYVRTAQNLDRGSQASQLSISEATETVLNDLLYTLYSKFEAIAEGHRAVHEVIVGIVERESMKKNETLVGSFKELWKLLQSEVNSLRNQLKCD
jgi:exocyst complex component 4